MKTIIAGGRSFMPADIHIVWLDNLHEQYVFTEIVCGKAKGADEFGEVWARMNNLSVKYFKAEWSLYGRSAGPRRNAEMADYAEALVLFPGGKGSANMLSLAKSKSLQIFVFE